MEEIGYFLLDEGIRLPLRAPVEGTISSILVHVPLNSLLNVGRRRGRWNQHASDCCEGQNVLSRVCY